MNIFYVILEALMALLFISFIVVTGSLIINSPEFFRTPGFLIRIFTYMTVNVAETRQHHVMPELKTRSYSLTRNQVYYAAVEAVKALEWTVDYKDDKHHAIQAVVRSPIWHFSDDIKITVSPSPSVSDVNVVSRSRIAMGDLAANTRHILDFYEMLEEKLPHKGAPEQE